MYWRKQIIAVADSYAKTLDAFKRNGAFVLNSQQHEAIKNEVFDFKNGVGCGRPSLNRKWVGAGPEALGKIAGPNIDPKIGVDRRDGHKRRLCSTGTNDGDAPQSYAQTISTKPCMQSNRAR